MKTQIQIKPKARVRSLFKLAQQYMTQVKNEPTPVAGRVGILERLKTTTEAGALIALVAELQTFEQASSKTIRRFLSVLSTKGVPARDLHLGSLLSRI